MKTYQVTRKFQVTIPKKIAEKIGIKPGDSVILEEGADGIVIKKVREGREKPEEVVSAIEDFSIDVANVRKYIKKAGDALNEGLSGNIPAQ